MATDPNAVRKGLIRARAKASGNEKAATFSEGVIDTMDLMGQHAGYYLESLESHWADFAQPVDDPNDAAGGFTPADFKAIHTILFGS